MKAFTKAHAALVAIGAPVTLAPDWFVMSAEENHSRKWTNGLMNDLDAEVEAILAAHGLDYCWNDAGTVWIHKA